MARSPTWWTRTTLQFAAAALVPVCVWTLALNIIGA